MNEDFDFFDDLDENCFRRKSQWQELHERWKVAMESTDRDLMNETLNDISLAQARTRQQIRGYKEVPSQRMSWHGEAWLARAMKAESFYQYMFNVLTRHMKEDATARIIEVERQKAERVKIQTELPVRLEILKARVKIATIRYELRRTRGEDHRLLSLLRKMGVIKTEDMPSLMDQVRAMEPTGPEKRAREDLDRWKAKLETAEEKLALNLGRIDSLVQDGVE